MQTEDHPLSYASFEGAIPKGHYGAGDVIVWDSGIYTSPDSSDPDIARKKIRAGYMKGEIKMVLLGEKLKGRFVLVKMKERGENAWLLIKENDQYASTADVTARVRSVLSNSVLPRDRTRIRHAPQTKPGSKKPSAALGKKAPMPKDIKPMLATLVDEPFDKAGWFFEVKWDGYRAIAEIKNGRSRVYSRNGKTFSYPPVSDALSRISHDCVLDGEIVALQNGRVDFHALQQYREAPVPLRYAVFDILWLDGIDLRPAPLSERKELLRTVVPENDDVLMVSEHAEEFGRAMFDRIATEGMEGIVAKDARSPYRDGKRTNEWLKIKASHEQEAIIVGFTEPRGSRKLIGSLVLAVHAGGALRYVGNSGGGFTQTEIQDLYKKLAKIVIKKSPLQDAVPVKTKVTWVRPQYVCQIKFTEWTKGGAMRHPVYAGLREDKSHHEVVREFPKAEARPHATATMKHMPVEISNREKVYWPDEGYTKGDLIDYYDRMSEYLLPQLKDRPENLNRHPNGIAGAHFFQKNFTADLPPYVETYKIWSDTYGEYRNYILCQNKETLLYMANLGCIEINPWNSRIQHLDRPDYMILDLDPHGRSMKDLALVAQEVRRVLDMACERHFPKTSGKTGLHVYVPLGAKYAYDDVKNFAELIMRIVHARLPDITSIERNPKKREGLMYLDYLQNRFGQTIACAYSVRPYPGATVSTPLRWEEVTPKLDPSKFTINTIEKRIKKDGDLWAPVSKDAVDLHDAIKCLQEHLG